MAGDININIFIKKLPEKWWFWLLVVLFIFVVLLGSHKIATAIVIFLLLVGVGSAIINLMLPSPNPNLWAICGMALFFALVIGIVFVSDEWQPKTNQIPQVPISIETILLS